MLVPISHFTDLQLVNFSNINHLHIAETSVSGSILASTNFASSWRIDEIQAKGT